MNKLNKCCEKCGCTGFHGWNCPANPNKKNITMTEAMILKQQAENIPNKNIEWQDKFIKEFGIHFEFAEGELQFAIGFIEGLLSAQRSELEHKIRTMFTADEVLAMKNGLKGEIMTLINREIAIAHTKDKGGKTSRLTSLAMRVSELLKT
jgi:hypothetical protein